MLHCTNNCDEKPFESSLTANVNYELTSQHAVSGSESDANLLMIDREIQIQLSQVESLDLNFLEDIRVASGIFQMHNVHKWPSSRMDSDSDESTLDLTDDSTSMDELSSLHDTPSGSINDKLITHSELSIQVEEQTSSGIGQNSRPSLFRMEADPMYHSYNRFDIKETERVKLEVRRVAQRSRVRQQKILNESLKQQIDMSRRQERVLTGLVLALPDDDESSESTSQKHGKFHHCMGGDYADESKHQVMQNIKKAIRAQIDANEIQIKELRDTRNEDAAFSLGLELMIARLDIVPHDAERLILSVAKLESERAVMWDQVRSTGINETIVQARVQEEIKKQRGIERAKILQTLSLRVQELQNENNDLTDRIRFLMMTLTQLDDSRLIFDERIESLESAISTSKKENELSASKEANLSRRTALRPLSVLSRTVRRRWR